MFSQQQNDDFDTKNDERIQYTVALKGLHPAAKMAGFYDIINETKIQKQHKQHTIVSEQIWTRLLVCNQ